MKKKLLISHGILLLVSTLIALVLLGGMLSIKRKVDGLYEQPLRNIEAISDMRLGITDVLRAFDRIMTETDREWEESYKILSEDLARDTELVHGNADILEDNLME